MCMLVIALLMLNSTLACRIYSMRITGTMVQVLMVEEGAPGYWQALKYNVGKQDTAKKKAEGSTIFPDILLKRLLRKSYYVR